MDSSMKCLPLSLSHYVGVKFRPTDQQLLHFLRCKIYGHPYFQAPISNFDLYSKTTEPWDIWQQFKGIDGEDLYFFTELKRLKKNSGHFSMHINRKIGSAKATWSGENSATPIFVTDGDHEQIIGYRKRFRYENDQLLEHHGEWIMHEYSLHPNYLMCPDDDSLYVLCRMRKNERPKRKLEQRLELQQPRKKRITAPNISHNYGSEKKTNKICSDMTTNQNISIATHVPDMTTNKKCFPELQPRKHRVITPETTWNLSPMPDMTINEDISGVAPMPDMTINEDISGVAHVSDMTINKRYSPELQPTEQRVMSHDIINNYNPPSILYDMTTNEYISVVTHVPDMTTHKSDLLEFQPTKDIVMTPEMISPLTHDKTTNEDISVLTHKSYLPELQPTEQRVMIPEMVYNSPLTLETTINEDICVEDYMSNMTTNEDNVEDMLFDMPLTFTEDSFTFGIEELPYGTNNDELIDNLNFDDI